MIRLATLIKYFQLARRMYFPKSPFKLLKMVFILLLSRVYHALRIAVVPYNPVNTVLTVTNRCNKDCSFCHYRGELNRNCTSDDLTYQQFLNILASPQVSNVGRISFYGGEPLLNTDLFEMITETKRRGYLVSIITNGLLIKKYTSELINTKIDLLTLSYYPEDHSATAEAVVLIGNSVPINLSFVFSKDRYKYLEQVLEFACANNLPMVTLENVNEHESGHDNESIRDGNSEFLTLKQELIKRYGKKTIIRWSPLTPLKSDSSRRITCCDFWDTAFINSKGEISGCCRYPHSTYGGSIFSSGDGINEKHLLDLRIAMKENKIPHHCENCNYLYASDPLYK